MRWWTWIVIVAPGLLAPARAWAQRPAPESDTDVAQALFDEARDRMDRGDYVKACPLLERSQKLDPGGGTLLNLALCYEGAGSLARAYSTFNEALSLARKDGRRDREQIAIARLDAIAPRLSRMRVSLDEPGLDAVVEIDKATHGSAILGVLTPIDAGRHHVRVSMRGRVPWDWEGNIAEGQSTELVAHLAPAVTYNETAPDLMWPPAPPPEPSTHWSAVSWVLFGTGAAALGVTIVTGALALDAKSSFDQNCLAGRQFCVDPARGAADRDRMQALAWTSTITLGVAITAVIIGFALPRVAEHRTAPRAARAGLAPSLRVSPGPSGLSVAF